MSSRPSPFLVGLLSTYKEGRTVRHAIRTALEACDHVAVFEGPAGDALEAECPATDLGKYDASVPINYRMARAITYQEGRWRTDARKRTAMLEWAKRFPAPCWVLWLDGDEVLVNGEYLRDWLQWFEWQDEVNPDEPPNSRCPLRLVELDGRVSTSYVKCVRGDLYLNYTLSIANATNTFGVEERAGMKPDHIARWLLPREEAINAGAVYWPPGPGPCDPYIVHRSMLRHPNRVGLRLHDQEAQEIQRLTSGMPPTD